MTDDKINFVDGDEIDIIGLIKGLIKPIIKQKIILLLVFVGISLIGILYYLGISKKYEVNYFVKNGIKNFTSNETVYSINVNTLNNWLESKIYQSNEMLSNHEKHYKLKANIIGNNGILELVTYSDEIQSAEDYIKSVINIMVEEPMFNQPVAISKQNLTDEIAILKREIQNHKMKLLEYESRKKQKDKNFESIIKGLEYNYNEINNILKRVDELSKTEAVKNNHIFTKSIESEKNSLMNLQNTNIVYQNIISSFQLNEEFNIKGIKLYINKLNEELSKKKYQHDLLSVLNLEHQVFRYEVNKSRFKYIILFIFLGLIIAYISAFIKEYYSKFI